MKTKNRAGRNFVLPVVLVTIVGGCEWQDVSMQKEMSELREKLRQAESAKATPVPKPVAAAPAPAGPALPEEAIQSALKKGAAELEQGVIGAFPGYRPESLAFGKVVFVYGEERPYRASVELRLRPVGASALTPEVPPVRFEVTANRDGAWSVPGQPALRQMLAEASARAASQSRTPPQRQPEPVKPVGGGGDPRPVSWGESAAQGGQVAPVQPAATPRRPVQGVPSADQTYEIRFD
jgi:hypothetical protein